MVLEVWDKMGRDDKGEKAPSVIVHLFEVRLPGNSRLLMVSPLLKHTGRSHFFLLRCHLPVDGGIAPSVSVTAAADGWSVTKKRHQKWNSCPAGQHTRWKSGFCACDSACACLSLTSIWSKANRRKQQRQYVLIWLAAVDTILALWLSRQNHLSWLSGFHNWRVLSIWILFNCLSSSD